MDRQNAAVRGVRLGGHANGGYRRRKSSQCSNTTFVTAHAFASGVTALTTSVAATPNDGCAASVRLYMPPGSAARAPCASG